MVRIAAAAAAAGLLALITPVVSDTLTGTVSCSDEYRVKVSDAQAGVDHLRRVAGQDCVAYEFGHFGSGRDQPFWLVGNAAVFASNGKDTTVTKPCGEYADVLGKVLAQCSKDGTVGGAYYLEDLLAAWIADRATTGF